MSKPLQEQYPARRDPTDPPQIERIPLAGVLSIFRERHHYDKAALEELAKSIDELGVLQPVVVRPWTEGERTGYQLVAGTRRFKAAQLLQARGDSEYTIPAIVRRLTPAQCTEINIVENLQREDVTIWEEIEGYEALVDDYSMTPEDIAERIGKSTSYVYQRLKLRALTPDARKALKEGELTAGHAILIARLTKEDQARALEAATDEYDRMSVRELDKWIHEEMYIPLKLVHFDTADATLVKKAGACTSCPKRSGFKPDLWPEIQDEDTCTDGVCLQQKAAAHFARVRQEHPDAPVIAQGHGNLVAGVQQGEALSPGRWVLASGKRPCQSARDAIIATVPGAGGLALVCTDPKCKRHGNQVHDRHGRVAIPTTKKAKKEQAQQALWRLKARAKTLGHDRTVAAIAKKAGRTLDVGVMFQALNAELWHDHKKAYCLAHGIEVKASSGGPERAIERAYEEASASGRVALVTELALRSRGFHGYYGEPFGKGLRAIAKRYRVDPAKLERAALAELKAKKKPKAKATKKRPKKAPKPK